MLVLDPDRLVIMMTAQFIVTMSNNLAKRIVASRMIELCQTETNEHKFFHAIDILTAVVVYLERGCPTTSSSVGIYLDCKEGNKEHK